METELRKAEATYKEDHPTVVRLRREVAELAGSESGSPRQDDLVEQLRNERNRLAELRDKYTGEHPEIQQAQKVVAALQQAVTTGSGNNAEPEADNPAYLVLKTRLQATEEDIRLSKEKIEDLLGKVEKYEGYLIRAPQVEKEYQRLQRDYQNTHLKYQEIRAKQMSARAG